MKREPPKRKLFTPVRPTGTDLRGTVRVMVTLADPERPKGTYSVRGNMTKTMTIRKAKVSEVAQAIHLWLFEAEEK